MVTYGIDISHHQDTNPNVAQAYREGVRFCFIKATEGAGFVDSDFSTNLNRWRTGGALVAAYHYVRSNASAAEQVANIKRNVPKNVSVIPDVEANSGGIALTREIVAALRAEGYSVPLLYLPRWYWQQIGSPDLRGLPPLWSSRYPDNVVGSLVAEYEAAPASYWNGYGGLEVAVLQFTSSARVAGYSPLDGNAYKGTPEQLAALLDGTGDDMFEQSDRDALADAGWRSWAVAQGKTTMPTGPEAEKLGIPKRLWNEPVHIVRAIVEVKNAQKATDEKIDDISTGGIDVAALADEVASRLGGDFATLVAQKVWAMARDSDPTTGPVT